MGGFFEVNPPHEKLPSRSSSYDRYDFALAVDLLEEYAQAFPRHLDFRTKANFRIYQHQLDYVFNRRLREMGLHQLNQMFLLLDQYDIEDFKQYSRKLVMISTSSFWIFGTRGGSYFSGMFRKIEAWIWILTSNWVVVTR